MSSLDIIEIAKETMKLTKEFITRNKYTDDTGLDAFAYENSEDFENNENNEESISDAYLEPNYDMPVCNHKKFMSDSHLGFAQGISYDGVPFEAELTQYRKTRNLCVMMPEIFVQDHYQYLIEKNDEEDRDIIELSVAQEYDVSILDVGMADKGIEDDINVINRYIEFLTERKIISFLSDVYNGSVMYRVDESGNSLVKILVTLEEDEDIWAYTDLNFKRRGITRTEIKVVI